MRRGFFNLSKSPTSPYNLVSVEKMLQPWGHIIQLPKHLTSRPSNIYCLITIPVIFLLWFNSFYHERMSYMIFILTNLGYISWPRLWPIMVNINYDLEECVLYW